MTDPIFLASQIAGIRDPRVATVNAFCDELMIEIPGSRVPYVAPHSNARNARVVSLLSNPGPRASGLNGSGFISRENDDPSAERMGRVWEMAGLSDEDAFLWNAYPWHVHETYPNGLPDELVDIGLSALRRLLELHPEVTAIVAHGGDARRSARRFLDSPDHRAFARARGLEVWETRHTSNRAFIMSPEQRTDAEQTMADIYRRAMAHSGLLAQDRLAPGNESPSANPPSESSSDELTPSELAAELHVDPKRVRAWLRKQGWRSAVEHAQRWKLTNEQVVQAREAFQSSTNPEDPGFEPSLLTVGEMLHVYTNLLAELRRRGLVRTNNAPIGDLAEYACAAYYEGELAPNSEKSFDLTAADGRRIQVKVRTIRDDTSSSGTFSAIRSMDFDACVFILADARTNTIEAAWEWTSAEVAEHGRFSIHTNSTLIRLGKVRAGVAGVDVTGGLNIAWQAMLELTGAPQESLAPEAL